MLIYPNPTQGMTEIRMAEMEEKHILYDLLSVTGEVMYSGVKTSDNKIIKVDLQNFSQGTYFIRIKYGDQTLTKKILKI